MVIKISIFRAIIDRKGQILTISIKKYSKTFPRNTPSFYVCSPPSGTDLFIYRIRQRARTPGGYFRYRISIRYRRSLFFAPSASENASRTPGGLFSHRMHIRYTRGPSPVPNGKGAAGDKFRVSGTREMVEGSGANKVGLRKWRKGPKRTKRAESGSEASLFGHGAPLKTRRVPEASCCRCGTSNFSKQETSQKSLFDRPLIYYGLLRSVVLCGQLLVADFFEHFLDGGFELFVFSSKDGCRVIIYEDVRLYLVVFYKALVCHRP